MTGQIKSENFTGILISHLWHVQVQELQHELATTVKGSGWWTVIFQWSKQLYSFVHTTQLHPFISYYHWFNFNPLKAANRCARQLFNCIYLQLINFTVAVYRSRHVHLSYVVAACMALKGLAEHPLCGNKCMQSQLKSRKHYCSPPDEAFTGRK